MDTQKVLQLSLNWIEGRMAFKDFLHEFLGETIMLRYPKPDEQLEVEHNLALRCHVTHSMMCGGYSEDKTRAWLAKELHYYKDDTVSHVHCVAGGTLPLDLA